MKKFSLINLIKKFIPKYFRRKLRLIYFNQLVMSIENKIYGKNFTFEGVKFDDKNEIIDFETKSLIRHGLYEKYEFEAIHTIGMFDNNFIDLGSSIGLTSFLVGKNINKKKLIMVEPNIELLNFSEKYINIHSDNENKFINKAINYENKNVYFNKEKSSLAGYVTTKNRNESLAIESTSISEIVNLFCLGSFNLLIDIEGYSFEPLFKEESVFEKCNKIIIEESFTSKYPKDKVFTQLEKLNFQIIYFEEAWDAYVIGAKKESLK
tara:strand:+ start:2463 stop:3257 length:795 start_codon:yes stop_codon:yes gene_type:complete